MRKIFKCIAAASLAAVSLLGLTACGPDGVPFGATTLGKPAKATSLSYQERNENKYSDITKSAESFAADFAALAYKQYTGKENFAVSPISVYMALSLAAQCSAGETQSEILSVLGVSYDSLLSGFSDYYRSIIADYTERNEYNKEIQTGKITLNNSVWLDSNTMPKQQCIETLADKFFCFSYQAPFADDNVSANQAVRRFVKDNTNGLIDRDFELSEETVFALINILYLKDLWNTQGQDLSLTDNSYDFIQVDGSVKNTKLLRGYSNSGQVVERESFSTFFTRTANGNKIDFILPKDGYTVDDVFTAENIKEVKSITS